MISNRYKKEVSCELLSFSSDEHIFHYNLKYFKYNAIKTALFYLNSISAYFQLQLTNLITLYLKAKGIVCIIIRPQDQSNFKTFLYLKNECEALNLISELINSKSNPIHSRKSK